MPQMNFLMNFECMSLLILAALRTLAYFRFDRSFQDLKQFKNNDHQHIFSGVNRAEGNGRRGEQINFRQFDSEA